VRVVSWNVAFRNNAAAQQGKLLQKLAPDLMLLQEINRSSIEILAEEAGADWLVPAVDLRVAELGESAALSRGVAIAGRGELGRAWLPIEVAMPERVLAVEACIDGSPVTAVSYHAPPGVTWGLVKPRQAVAAAAWLAGLPGPVVLGADANTPLIDAAEFAHTRTHWHTGDPKLCGEPGDDQMWGPAKVHHLQDALRSWIAENPGSSEALSAPPLGPLAVTHRTGKRKSSAGTARRFDCLWITGDCSVKHIGHLYEDAIAAGSDHAIVIAELALTTETLPSAFLHPLAETACMIAKPKSAAGASSAVPRSTHQPLATDAEQFTPGRYCRNCGWPFTPSQNRTVCQVPQACARRRELPMTQRGRGCPRNNRVHPEWRPVDWA
jgi:hypothetical protein